MLVCGKCGEENRDVAKFCNRCGSVLDTPAPGETQMEATPALEENASTQDLYGGNTCSQFESDEPEFPADCPSSELEQDAEQAREASSEAPCDGEPFSPVLPQATNAPPPEHPISPPLPGAPLQVQQPTHAVPPSKPKPRLAALFAMLASLVFLLSAGLSFMVFIHIELEKDVTAAESAGETETGKISLDAGASYASLSSSSLQSSSSIPASPTPASSAPASFLPAVPSSSAEPQKSPTEIANAMVTEDIDSVLVEFYRSYLACLNERSIAPLVCATGACRSEVQSRLDAPGNEVNTFTFLGAACDEGTIKAGEDGGLPSITFEAQFSYYYRPRDGKGDEKQGKNRQAIQIIQENGEWHVNRFEFVEG